MDYSRYFDFLNEASQDKQAQVAENEADMERREDKFENISDILEPITLVASELATQKLSNALGLEESETKQLLSKIVKGDSKGLLTELKSQSAKRLQDKLNTGKLELQNKLNEYNSKFDDLTKNLSNLQKNKLNELLDQKTKLQNRLDELRSNNGSQSDIDDLTAKLNSIEDSTKDILNNLDQSTRDQLNSFLDSNSDSISAIRAQLNISDDVLNNIKTGNLSALREQATQLAKTRAQNIIREAQENIKQKFEQTKQQALDELEKQKSNLQDKVNQGRSQLQDEIDSRKSQLQDEINGRRLDLQKQIDDTKAQLKQAKQDLQDQANKLAEDTSNKIRSLQDENTGLQDEILTRSQRLKQLTSEMGDLESRGQVMDSLAPMRMMGLGGNDDEDDETVLSKVKRFNASNSKSEIDRLKVEKQKEIDKLNKDIEDRKLKVKNNEDNITDTYNNMNAKMSDLQQDATDLRNKMIQSRQDTMNLQQQTEQQLQQEQQQREQQIEQEVNQKQTDLENDVKNQTDNLTQQQADLEAKQAPVLSDTETQALTKTKTGLEKNIEDTLKDTGETGDLEDAVSFLSPEAILPVLALTGITSGIQALTRPKNRPKNNIIFSPSYTGGISY